MAGRDGLLTLAVILRYIGNTGKSIDEALLDLPRYTTLQAKVSVDPEKALIVREKLIDAMRHRCSDVVVFGEDGGVKCVISDNQFVTFRMSKTEAGVYRVIADAKEQAEAEALLEEGKNILQKLSK
jgi:phosphomannomutase